jgi:hypothetical protein
MFFSPPFPKRGGSKAETSCGEEGKRGRLNKKKKKDFKEKKGIEELSDSA